MSFQDRPARLVSQPRDDRISIIVQTPSRFHMRVRISASNPAASRTVLTHGSMWLALCMRLVRLKFSQSLARSFRRHLLRFAGLRYGRRTPSNRQEPA
jgi:hypothetical protein